MQTPVRDVLNSKGNVVYTIAPTASVQQAVQVMKDHGVGSVVVKEGQDIHGLVTEREIVLRVVREAQDPSRTVVAGAMMAPVPTISPDTTVGEAMALMTDRRTRHLPVVEDGRLVGLVSIGDLTLWITRHLEAEVHDLESFITGAYV